MKVRVRCTYEIEVEVIDGSSAADNLVSYIEESCCPGTGAVGSALEAIMELHEAQSTCWACALGGTNKIIE